jgi:signal transduction histidine kinase
MESQTERAPSAVQGRIPSRLSVLLVEDDPTFAEFLKTTLPHPGEVDLDLRWEPRLASALEVIRDVPVDAVLLDLNLPDSRGLDTLTRVVDAASHMPVVVLTGVDDAGLATEALRRGAQDWLTKGRLDPELVSRATRYAVERKRLEDRLIRSQKLEAVGRLAGRIAHEFNNLLTVILGNADLMSPAIADAELREGLSEIQRAATRGSALMQHLLGFTRNQPVRPDIVDAGSLLAGATSLLKAVLPESIEMRTGPSHESGPVRVDRGQFDQILLNLAINARDAMPSGGTLTLQSWRETVTGTREGTLSSLGRYIVIEVSDTGTGIAPDVLPHIFEPFFSTKKDRGTGLGLSLCAEILARYGGALRVRSTLDVGTTFLLYLPEAVDQARRSTPGDGLADGADDFTILVVDDDVRVRGAVVSTLRRSGWTVLEASGGAEALAVAAAHPSAIDLLLTDVVMPIMRGPELASRLVDLRPGTRVLFMTGYADELAGLASSAAASQSPILRKPFTPSVLTGKVRELLRAPAS